MAFGETFLEVILRGAGHILVDIILERVLHGTGYHLCRLLRIDIEPHGVAALLTGVLTWCLLFWLGYTLIGNIGGTATPTAT